MTRLFPDFRRSIFLLRECLNISEVFPRRIASYRRAYYDIANIQSAVWCKKCSLRELTKSPLSDKVKLEYTEIRFHK